MLRRNLNLKCLRVDLEMLGIIPFPVLFVSWSQVAHIHKQRHTWRTAEERHSFRVSTQTERSSSLTPSVRQYRDGSRRGCASAHMHSSGRSRSSLASAFLHTILPCWNLWEDCSQTRNAVSQYTFELPVLSRWLQFCLPGDARQFSGDIFIVTAGGMLLTSI